MTKGRQPERYKVPPAWRPTALRRTSKGLETEKREGKEKEQVTADEIIVGIVGIVDSPSARAALRCAAAYARSTETALRAIHVVD
jgi:K+-sensing histidine kinase KdpD